MGDDLNVICIIINTKEHLSRPLNEPRLPGRRWCDQCRSYIISMQMPLKICIAQLSTSCYKNIKTETQHDWFTLRVTKEFICTLVHHRLMVEWRGMRSSPAHKTCCITRQGIFKRYLIFNNTDHDYSWNYFAKSVIKQGIKCDSVLTQFIHFLLLSHNFNCSNLII